MSLFMAEGQNDIFVFEDFLLDTGAAELHRDGTLIPVEPQVFDLLVLLLRNHDRVVSRDEIIDHVWGGRAVSDSAISSRINALRKALGDDGTEQRLVKTLHGRGLRFTATPEAVTDASGAATMAGQTARREKPSIAVLPFRVMADSSELVFLADGIAEDILNALSRFHALSVIARNSSFTFKGRTVAAHDVAESLGATYVLEGSVRQLGTRLRVAVQLIEAAQDRTIWSDRIDTELNDIFEVQDEITARAVASIAPQAEYHGMATAYRKEPTSLSDWERVMKARWHMDKFTREDTETAMGILHDTIAQSPDLALAHSSLAYCHAHRMLNAWGGDAPTDIASAAEAARRAVALDAHDAGSHAVLGLAAMFTYRFDECMDHLDTATRLNPNLASGFGFRATASGCLGDIETTLESYETAIRLSPADPTRPVWMSGVGIALIIHHRYEDCLENADKMLRADPDYGPALRQRTSSLAHLGRMDEARVALADLLKRMPHLTATRLAQMVPLPDPAHREHWLDGLRMAGLPD